MKRIALFLAAAAALASCVEEKALVPEQTTDNLVTIKALATKTTLGEDGASVVWENNDAIKIVFKGDEDTYETVFTTSLAENASSADFTGIIGDEVTEEAYGTVGFAVYPSTTELGERNGLSRLEFSVASEQDGKIGKDENCSYANISLSDIKAKNTTTASFHNLLSIIKVVVPEGVKSVTVETTEMSVIVIGQDGAGNDIVQSTGFPETPIAGTAPFVYDNDAMELDFNNWADQKTAFDEETSSSYQVDVKLSKVVLKDASNNNLVAGTYDLLVFPGEHDNLKITVEGTNASYEKSIGAFTFEAGRYHNLNLTNIFDLGSTSYAASPFGGTVEIPVITTADAYEVGDPSESWLTKTPSAKGAFRKDVVSFTAEANTTGAVRTATVKINEVDVVVSQKGYVPELLNEYVETYSMHGQPFTGTLKIEQTDDPSQGVYKVTICGQQMYADYSSNQLTIYDGKNSRTLTVSPYYKTISASSLTLGYSTYSDYKAILPLGPAVLTAEEDALVGTYNETWNHPKHAPATNAMEISASEEASFGQLKVKFLVTGDGSAYTGYASLEESVLKVQIGGQSHAKLGTQWNPDVVVNLTVKPDGTLTMPTWKDGSYNDLSNYVATKVGTSEPEPETPGAGDEEDSSLNAFVGTWSESFDFQQYVWSPAATYTNASVKITIEDGKLLATNILLITPQYGTPSSGTYVGEVSADGLTVTFADKDMNNPSHMTLGPVSNFVLILSADGKTLSATSTCGGAVKNYVATKK